MSAVVGNIEDLVEIVETAVEAAAGIASAIAGFEAVEVARDYYNLYAAQRNFYYTVFHNDVESPMATQIHNETPYSADYVGRMLTLTDPTNGIFGGEFDNIAAWIARHAGAYDQTPDPKITESEQTLARMRSDWANYLFRYEELWRDEREDDRWARRLAVHNLAIKQGTNVAANLDAGLAEYQHALGELGAQLATFSNGAAKALGYKRGANDADIAVNRYEADAKRVSLQQKVNQDPVGYLYG